MKKDILRAIEIQPVMYDVVINILDIVIVIHRMVTASQESILGLLSFVSAIEGLQFCVRDVQIA